jgi:hypothetical protein
VPGGGGGGVTILPGYGGWLPGGHGANGKISIAYIQSQAGMRSFLAHMPNPDADATFVPVVSVGDGLVAPDPFDVAATPNPWPVISPHLGMPVKYNGTYTVALTAGWLGQDSHPVTAEIRINGPTGPIGSVTATGWVNVATDPLNERGLVMLSTVTLPPKWMPPDNQLVSYDVIVRAGSPGQNDGQNDRFLDMILLDVTGSTVACVVAGANGFANWFVDEPESGQSMGAILGSNFGRTGAVSATDTIILASGGPFVLEPGAENLFLA